MSICAEGLGWRVLVLVFVGMFYVGECLFVCFCVLVSLMCCLDIRLLCFFLVSKSREIMIVVEWLKFSFLRFFCDILYMFFVITFVLCQLAVSMILLLRMFWNWLRFRSITLDERVSHIYIIKCVLLSLLLSLLFIFLITLYMFTMFIPHYHHLYHYIILIINQLSSSSFQSSLAVNIFIPKNNSDFYEAVLSAVSLKYNSVI